MYNQDMHIVKQTICGSKLEKKYDENRSITHYEKQHGHVCDVSPRNTMCMN